MDGTTLRRIEQRNPLTGELTGVLQTTLTDEELRERDRQMAERRDAMLATNLSVVTAARAAANAEREALAGIGVDARARDHLRAAHTRLAVRRDELARRREVAAAAAGHVARCEAAAAVAQQVVAGIAERASAAIVEQLEKGESPNGPTPTRAAAEKAEAARADLAHAGAAKAEVDALAAQAERAVTAAESHLKEAARGVIKLRVSELQAQIGGLVARTEALRTALNTLLPTLSERRWPVPWPAEAEALLHDPEAALDLDNPTA